MNDRYVIAANFSDDGEPLFWNNEDGWVSLADATVFSVLDTTELQLPIEAFDWVRLPVVEDQDSATSAELLRRCLIKYITLVGEEEGVDFISRGDWTEEEYHVMNNARNQVLNRS